MLEHCWVLTDLCVYVCVCVCVLCVCVYVCMCVSVLVCACVIVFMQIICSALDIKDNKDTEQCI